MVLVVGEGCINCGERASNAVFEIMGTMFDVLKRF